MRRVGDLSPLGALRFRFRDSRLLVKVNVRNYPYQNRVEHGGDDQCRLKEKLIAINLESIWKDQEHRGARWQQCNVHNQ